MKFFVDYISVNLASAAAVDIPQVILLATPVQSPAALAQTVLKQHDRADPTEPGLFVNYNFKQDEIE